MRVSEVDLDARAAPEVRSLYDTYEPWSDRTDSEVEDLLANSDEVVGLRTTDSDRLVACARVLTDYRAYGMVYDVIVAADRRGEGLGARLLEAVVDHPRLRDVALSLHSREELVPFYEACGFERYDDGVEGPDGETITYRWMRTDRRGDD